MIYGQDEPVATPTIDLYDTNMMQMYVNAAREQYKAAQEEQKEFLKTYGDFYSPFAKDNDFWYNHTMGPVQNLFNEAAARGIDLARSPEGRAMLARALRDIPYAKLATIRRNAKLGEEYLKNRAELQKKGLYSPELENWDLQRQGLPAFEDWDSATMGAWTRTSPIEYKTLHDFVAPIVDNTKPGELSQAEVEAFGMNYDPRRRYTGISKDMLKNPIVRNIPGLIGNPIYDFYYDQARKDLIAQSGDPNYNPTHQQILDQFTKNAVDSVPEYLIRPSSDADEFATMAQKQAYAMQEPAAKNAHDEHMARTYGGRRGGGGGGYGANDDQFADIFEEARYNYNYTNSDGSIGNARFVPAQSYLHRMDPVNGNVSEKFDKDGKFQGYSVKINDADDIFYAHNSIATRGKEARRLNFSKKTKGVNNLLFEPTGALQAKRTKDGKGWRYFQPGVLYGQNLNKRKVDDKGKVYYDQTYFKDRNGAPLVIDMEVVPGGYGAESQYRRENYTKLNTSKKGKK